MRGIANSNSTDESVVPDLDVAAGHANVDVDFCCRHRDWRDHLACDSIIMIIVVTM